MIIIPLDCNVVFRTLKFQFYEIFFCVIPFSNDKTFDGLFGDHTAGNVVKYCGSTKKDLVLRIVLEENWLGLKYLWNCWMRIDWYQGVCRKRKLLFEVLEEQIYLGIWLSLLWKIEAQTTCWQGEVKNLKNCRDSSTAEFFYFQRIGYASSKQQPRC